MVECTVLECPACGKERPYPGSEDGVLAETRFKTGVTGHYESSHGTDPSILDLNEALSGRKRMDVPQEIIEEVEDDYSPKWGYWGLFDGTDQGESA